MLDRMLTTKYPLGVVLMELAHQMRIRRLVLRAHWLPRLENMEAHALTNFDFRHFKPENRVEVSLDSLKFAVLDGLFVDKATHQKRAQAVADKAGKKHKTAVR